MILNFAAGRLEERIVLEQRRGNILYPHSGALHRDGRGRARILLQIPLGSQEGQDSFGRRHEGQSQADYRRRDGLRQWKGEPLLNISIREQYRFVELGFLIILCHSNTTSHFFSFIYKQVLAPTILNGLTDRTEQCF